MSDDDRAVQNADLMQEVLTRSFYCSQVPLFLVDGQWQIREVSTGACDLLGRTAENLNGCQL